VTRYFGLVEPSTPKQTGADSARLLWCFYRFCQVFLLIPILLLLPAISFTDRQKRFLQSFSPYSAGVLGSRAPKETCLAGEMVEIACLKIA
jgi:hypothetical protein